MALPKLSHNTTCNRRPHVILFSSRNLELAFARDELTKWDKVKYIILMTVLPTLLSGPFFWVKPVYGAKMSTLNILVSYPCAVLSAYIAYRGIKKCFQVNESGGGNSFFQRWACLTVPVGFRVMIYFLPAYWIIGALVIFFRKRNPELYEILPNIYYLAGPVFAFTYYHLITRSFLRLGELLMHSRIDTEEISPT